jgi:hypothetical protein
MNVRSIDKFHRSRPGYLLFGLVEFLLAGYLLNRALESGDWWLWLLGIIFLVGFFQNMGRMIMGAKK